MLGISDKHDESESIQTCVISIAGTVSIGVPGTRIRDMIIRKVILELTRMAGPCSWPRTCRRPGRWYPSTPETRRSERTMGRDGSNSPRERYVAELWGTWNLNKCLSLGHLKEMRHATCGWWNQDSVVGLFVKVLSRAPQRIERTLPSQQLGKF